MSSDFVIAVAAPGKCAALLRCQSHASASSEARRRPRGQPLGLALLLGFGFGLGLALPPTDRRAEDVAEAGARVGRAELRHRLLLLVDLARLDRQRDLAGGAVELGDLGIEPLANRETVGPLLAAIAR